MQIIDVTGVLAGAITLLTYVPQSIKTLRTRKTRDLSLLTLTMLALSAALWVVFGIAKDLPAVWVTNLVVTVLGLTILVVKIKNSSLEKN